MPGVVVRSRKLPSEKVPFNASGCVAPGRRSVELDGVSSSEVNVTPTSTATATVSLNGPFLAVIVTSPLPRAVTRPSAETAATNGLLEE